jgi:hypothetical protein
LEEALLRYERELETWRSAEWLATYRRLPVHRRLLNGFSERVAPVYHLLENAQEFTGHPLMCLEQHAHYFRLVCHASSAPSRTRGPGCQDHGIGRCARLPQTSVAGRDARWHPRAAAP